MTRRPDVISGEATESESEEEINQHVTEKLIAHVKQKSTSTPHGIVVAGEAPESDDEELNASSSTNAKFSSEVSDTSQKGPEKISKHRNELQHTSLLHRKLHERNIWLRKDITDFIHNTIGASDQKLNATNQQLLRSQVQLQEVVTNLQMLQNNTVQLNKKLAAALSYSFIPEIKIPD